MNDLYDQDREPPAPPPEPPAGGGGTTGTIPPMLWDGSAANWGDFHGGFRCTICGIDWPMEDPTLFGLGLDHEWQFQETVPCPLCAESCRIFSNSSPIPIEEAWSKVKHKRFADYYERTRGVSPYDD